LPLTNGSGSCYFRHCPLLLYEDKFTSFSKFLLADRSTDPDTYL